MKNVLDPCRKCPEALCFMAGGGEESALGPVRALWTSKPKTRATGLQMIHGFTQKKLSRFVRATAPAASHRYRSSEPKDAWCFRLAFLTSYFTANVESYVAGERQKARIRVGWRR